MPSGLLSNLNLASRLTFHSAAVRVKLPPTLCSIEAPLSNSSVKSLRYSSSNRCGVRIMASSGSVAASGDLVVDSLVSSHGSFSSFVKSSGVFFNDGSSRSCRRGRVSMRSECRMGAQRCIVLDLERRSYGSTGSFLKGLSDCRNFSSSCYSDRVAPQVSTEEPLGAEPLSSLAIPAEPTPSPSILKLLSGACYLPHPAKEETGGEDAYFICVDEQAIGVADGVGGWADVGVNAGLYARELMSNSVKAIKEVASGNVDPLMVLEKAHAQTKALGSSTACIITLKNKTLRAINLGDSGFIIVRDGRIIFESPVQQHGFNFTYQLENNTRGDQPSSGDVFEIPVVPGDVIVAGSDGLYDNLYSKEVAAIVGDSVKHGLSPDGTAQKIADFARARALDSKHQTPFSTAAQEAGFSYYGGKLDDLTVVVSYVSA